MYIIRVEKEPKFSLSVLMKTRASLAWKYIVHLHIPIYAHLYTIYVYTCPRQTPKCCMNVCHLKKLYVFHVDDDLHAFISICTHACVRASTVTRPHM